MNIYDRNSTQANDHRMLHIPIQFGINKQKDKWRFGLNVEALVNIRKSYDGYFLNENNSVDRVTHNNDQDYMSNNIGVSFSVGGHLGYMLGDHFELFVSPRFRFNDKSYLNDNQTLKITNNFAGLRTGLTYHF